MSDDDSQWFDEVPWVKIAGTSTARFWAAPFPCNEYGAWTASGTSGYQTFAAIIFGNLEHTLKERRRGVKEDRKDPVKRERMNGKAAQILRSLVRKALRGECKPITQEEFWRLHLQKFGHSRAFARAVYNDVVPNSWKKKGKTPK